MIPALPVAGVMILVVLLGHDLGTALVLILLAIGALWVAGVRLRIFALPVAAAAAVVAPLAMLNDNRMRRITDWLSGAADSSGSGYQPQHGLRALASGGWAGLGLGQSREKWNYLPAADNDFIFAIIGGGGSGCSVRSWCSHCSDCWRWRWCG